MKQTKVLDICVRLLELVEKLNKIDGVDIEITWTLTGEPKTLWPITPRKENGREQ